MMKFCIVILYHLVRFCYGNYDRYLMFLERSAPSGHSKCIALSILGWIF